MHKLLTSTFAVLALTQVSAFAGKCDDKLLEKSSGPSSFQYLKKQAGGVPALSDCKEVHHDPSNTHQIIYITADRLSLITHRLNIQGVPEGTLSLSAVPGGIRDLAAMAGRLIIVTNDDRLIVVGRNGNIFELLNSKLRSLSVQEVKVDPKTQDLVATSKDNTTFSWTEDQLTKKLNESDQNRAISF